MIKRFLHKITIKYFEDVVNHYLRRLTFSTFTAYSADDISMMSLIFSQITGFDISCKMSPMAICIKCQILFSGKYKKTILIYRLLKNITKSSKRKTILFAYVFVCLC